MKRVVSMLVVIMIMVTGVGVKASEIVAPGIGSSKVDLTVEAATFSVTVPSNLTLDVSSTGEVTVANNVKIVNNGHGVVKVTGVTITPTEGWAIVGNDVEMSQEKVGSKKLWFKINGCETNSSGIIFNPSKFPKLNGSKAGLHDEISIIYDAKIPAQREKITGAKIAEIVFTIGWDE